MILTVPKLSSFPFYKSKTKHTFKAKAIHSAHANTESRHGDLTATTALLLCRPFRGAESETTHLSHRRRLDRGWSRSFDLNLIHIEAEIVLATSVRGRSIEGETGEGVNMIGADRGAGLPMTSRGWSSGISWLGGGVGAITTTPAGPAETEKNIDLVILTLPGRGDGLLGDGLPPQNLRVTSLL